MEFIIFATQFIVESFDVPDNVVTTSLLDKSLPCYHREPMWDTILLK